MMTKTTIEPITLTLDVPAFPGGKWPLNPTLITSESAVVLVDTGMTRSEKLIAEELEKRGLSIGHLTTIILTHQDIDHVGSLAKILEINPNIEVFSHELDRPYIEGDLPLIKRLPTPVDIQFSEGYVVPPTPVIKRTLVDGEELDIAGGLVVIHTPGHTEGHISLYHPASKTLITGDAMLIRGPKLQGPNPMQTPDLDQAYQSLTKFASFDIKRVICYHGGMYESETLNEEIAQIAATGPAK
ncbi:MBL fold metallo-hydrolase [Priestia aryabhattai]|uniref:MBL fold metallo-hydrolase n=1 Tax=Priestia aryabhattai TaxID=412384 RepID=UPI001876E261|nr:MBL fold metallo-hydrolase [Priestia aryabhattai]MBE5102227.1 MBL fold metallo-hydrolase [Priestia aryabhattai]